MTDLLSSVIDSTVASRRNGNGAKIISEQHDKSKINWVRGMADPGEMIACGYLPQLRRLADETDDAYAARITPLVMSLPQAERDIILKAGVKAANQRASLYSRNGKVAMFSALTPPWHGLGTLVDQAATSAEALKFAQLDNWDLQKVQQQIDWGGKLIPVNGSWAVVRGDTGKILGTVGERYTVFSNEDAFQFLDDVIGQESARYETAGAIDDGSTVWVLARFKGEVQVTKEDFLRQYILCGTSHDGSSAIWVVPTDERVACANTYRIAMSGRSAGYSFRHTKNVSSRAKEVAKMLGIVHERQEEFADTAKVLASTPLADVNEYFQGCIDDIVAVTVAGQQLTKASEGEILSTILRMTDVDERHTAEKALERATKRRKEVLEDILERYESDRNNGMSSIAGSAWAAVNAVTEYADHSPLVRYKGDDNTRKESRFTSTLIGSAADVKDSAVNRAMAYAAN